jgi:hypothetical protein
MQEYVSILDVYRRGDTTVLPPIFYPPKTNTAIKIQSTYTMGSSFTKLRLLFHIVSIIINTLFPTLRETLYAGRVEMYAVSARRRRRQNGGLGVHASGVQKHGSRWCLIRSVGRKIMKNSPAHSCNCLPCEQIGVQSSVYVPLTS